MFEKLDRSWDLTKATFRVMHADKELFAYPFISTIISLVFIIAMIGPLIVAVFFSDSPTVLGTLQYVLFFVLYFGLAFIAVFFNTCVVYTAKTRFAGGNATLSSSIKFAFSRIGAIIKWSALSATVGIILRILESTARNTKGIGRIILQILVGLLGMAWAVTTMFVVPSIVYKGLGPIDSIKDSLGVLKKTWGEALIKYVGLETVKGFCIFFSLLFLLPLGIIGFMTGKYLLIAIAILLFIFWIIIVSVVFGIANSVFDTALYAYATSGKVPFGYRSDHMKNAFKKISDLGNA